MAPVRNPVPEAILHGEGRGSVLVGQQEGGHAAVALGDEVTGKQRPANTPAVTAKPASVLVAAHFSPEVRLVLKLIEADSAKNLKQLLGEAINDLADKYGKPRPYA
jgi:hypothetical protein